MPLTVDQLRNLARANVDLDPAARAQVLAALGEPTAEDQAASAVALLDHPDRNIRVAGLRVLARADGQDAIAGILRGLDDPTKRVREVAAKSSAGFVDDSRIIQRLQMAVERGETGSDKPALRMLTGVYTSPYGLTALTPVADALTGLLSLPTYRQQALLALLRARALTDDLAELLREIVDNGTKEEAVAATRRLCGLRVAHHGELDDDTRRHADRAWGDVYVWVRVPDER
jgi:HEAT repeat protein